MQADALFAALPLVAILRGLRPERALAVATVLYDAGVRVFEVPLNSPEPFKSIATLAGVGDRGWLIGAGTVLSAEDVRRTHEAGGRIIVSPNCNPEVIRTTIELGLEAMPGIATATEAINAIHAGARFIKLFPATTYGPGHLKALCAVLPSHSGVFPVGGIVAADIESWFVAGAAGFGFGSELFKPDYSLAEIAQRAANLVAEIQSCRLKINPR